ncbi:MAG: aminoglycoside phosphotransferase family protein [Ruminococcus sp.]|nr:aminoglycoside phosphotransferase family protein [Ruminococcus sp.]
MKISSISTGHINSTYLVECRTDKYILQSLNRKVFRNPYAVMDNIKKIEEVFDSSGQDRITVPHFLTAGERNSVETDGEIWRVYEYTEQSGLPENYDYLTGYAFGKYINLLNAENIVLENTIDNFHDFDSYYKRLPDSVMKRFDGLRGKLEIFGDIPKRNVHNDAKKDNIIFSEKITIIDLDTSMRGFVATDYGDMIRSGGDIHNITQGFADGLDGILSDKEIYSLYYGILYVTAELAMRYIIDSVSDERYFITKTPEQCRKRSEDLLAQLEYFENNSAMKNIINKAF